MAKEGRLEIVVAGERFIVDLDNVTYERVLELTERVAGIRRKQSIYAKYPFQEGETREQWVERVSKESQEEYARKDGESEEDHLKRMFESKTEVHNMVGEVFRAVAQAFGQKQFSDDDLKKTNWIKLKRFLYDVLSACDIPAEDLRPMTAVR